jgi:hypothetical protein
MFKITFNLEQLEKNYETFEDAFIDFYYMIKESVSQGTAWQVLETMHWIQENNNEPLLFYDARDKAYKLGLLEKDGKLRVKKGK